MDISKLERTFKIDLVDCPNCGKSTEQHRDWNEEWSITENYCIHCDHTWDALSPQDEAQVRVIFAISKRVDEELGTWEIPENLDQLSKLSRHELEQIALKSNQDYQKRFSEELTKHLIDIALRRYE